MLIATALLLAASPPARPLSPESGARPSEPHAAATGAPAKPTNYCVVDTITGSRIPRRVCRTRKEWLAEGWDPLAK